MIKRIAYLLLLSLWGLSTQVLGDVQITLKKDVKINTALYTLADIAVIESTNSSLKQRLMQMQIGVAPSIGYNAIVSADQVARRIRQQAPTLVSQLVWHGADRVRIKGVGIQYNSDSLIAKTKAHLLSRLRERFGSETDYQVTAIGVRPQLRHPHGKVKIQARLANYRFIQKRMCVWADVFVNGRSISAVPVWFAVKAEREVLVAKRALAPRRVLKPRYFKVKRIDIAGIPGSVLTDARALATAQWLQRPLQKGQPLQLENLRLSPAVLRDQDVVVNVISKSIRISTRAVAKQDAKIGQDVWVMNKRSGKKYKALVIGQNTVEVHVD